MSEPLSMACHSYQLTTKSNIMHNGQGKGLSAIIYWITAELVSHRKTNIICQQGKWLQNQLSTRTTTQAFSCRSKHAYHGTDGSFFFQSNDLFIFQPFCESLRDARFMSVWLQRPSVCRRRKARNGSCWSLHWENYFNWTYTSASIKEKLFKIK